MRAIGRLVLAVLAALISPSALAQGWFIGGSAGQSYLEASYSDVDLGEIELDEEDSAWRVFLGYYPAGAFGVEAGYRNFGVVEGEPAGLPFRSETTAWDAFVTARIPVGKLDVFGKVGAVFWDSETTLGELVREFETGSDLAWGAGLALHLGRTTLRAEWEEFEVGGFEALSVASVGLTFRF